MGMIIINVEQQQNGYEPGFGKIAFKFLKKYFWSGQYLEEKQVEKLESLADHATWQQRLHYKHRRLIGLLIPMVFFFTIWLSLAIRWDYWSFFPKKYSMSITMIFGALVAGMTSEGGGAIAFPVMTLALKIKPQVARDFSLMIQSCGMAASAFTIFWMKIKLEKHSIVYCSVGALFGIIFGFHLVDNNLKASEKKMGFVSIWFSFAVALFLNNFKRKFKMYSSIQNVGWIKILVLILAGFVGGIFTSFSGSGVDICSFSVLTLLFNVSEKVATPTSVVLMAINTIVGFYWRQFIMAGEISQDAWEYVAVCVPIVVVCAPFGSVLSSHFHRQILAAFIYIIEIVALVSAFVIVEPNLTLTLVSVGIMAAGFIFFCLIRYMGDRMQERQMRINANTDDDHNADLPNVDNNSPMLTPKVVVFDANRQRKEAWMDANHNSPIILVNDKPHQPY